MLYKCHIIYYNYVLFTLPIRPNTERQTLEKSLSKSLRFRGRKLLGLAEEMPK